MMHGQKNIKISNYSCNPYIHAVTMYSIILVHCLAINTLLQVSLCFYASIIISVYNC